jgi:7,8-didemethyl-8-hydroxy-5-deazariboflavin synthase CofG subunit
MKRDEVLALLREAERKGCKEALFTFGERPEVFPSIRKKLRSMGYDTVIEYLYDLCGEALNFGLLPHSNGGVMDREEMKLLREVNASLGLMLESASPRLCGKGMPHENSPGKRPEVRLRMMEEAGKLKIPFTTGLLLGIGETSSEIRESLEAILYLHSRYGHIQEVIIQNFKAKAGTPMGTFPEPSLSKMAGAVRQLRALSPEMAIQIPPNLNPDRWKSLLLSGANDLGGISPVTLDYINPETEWPDLERVREETKAVGFRLQERLPIYPRYIERGWYSSALEGLIQRYAGPEGWVQERWETCC